MVRTQAEESEVTPENFNNENKTMEQEAELRSMAGEQEDLTMN